MSTPFWPPPPERYPGTLPEKADVLVVGGGIAGMSLLWHLTRLRIDAVLLERHHLAWGASGRNAGFLLQGVASSYAEAIGKYGRDRAREIWHITSENHDRMIEAARGMNVGHRRLGSTILPASDEERGLLIQSEHLLREDGFDVRWTGECLVNPRDGEIDPSAMVAALARQARDRAIREGVDVIGLEPRRHGVIVTAADHTRCDAGVVVLATNAYTPRLVPSVKIQPQRAQMAATAPDPNPIAPTPVYSNFGFRYWRQLATGEVLIGGWRDTSFPTESTYDDEPTAEIQGHLDRALSDLHAGAAVTHRWAGTMGFTESGLPLSGRVDGMPNVYVCAGFTGHGMAFAFMTAKSVAEQI